MFEGQDTVGKDSPKFSNRKRSSSELESKTAVLKSIRKFDFSCSEDDDDSNVSHKLFTGQQFELLGPPEFQQELKWEITRYGGKILHGGIKIAYNLKWIRDTQCTGNVLLCSYTSTKHSIFISHKYSSTAKRYRSSWHQILTGKSTFVFMNIVPTLRDQGYNVF